MLRLVVEGQEVYNNETNEFTTVNDTVLYLEHSLISISKWESKFQKPFLSQGSKTVEEIFGYIEAMMLGDLVDPSIIYKLGQKHIDRIQEYIDSKESATTFGNLPSRRGVGETITSELIYYWMVSFNIPFECQYWHINRLFALIRICNIKNAKPKKMSRSQIAQQTRELNAQRRAELNTTG